MDRQADELMASRDGLDVRAQREQPSAQTVCMATLGPVDVDADGRPCGSDTGLRSADRN